MILKIISFRNICDESGIRCEKIIKLLRQKGVDCNKLILYPEFDSETLKNELKGTNCGSVIITADKKYSEEISEIIKIGFPFSILFLSDFDGIDFENSVNEFIRSEFGRREKFSIRCFQPDPAVFAETIEEVTKMFNRKAEIKYEMSFGDVEIDFIYGNDTSKILIDDALRLVVTKLDESVYSVDGRSLAELFGDLAKLRGLKVKTAESFTGGAVASELIKIPGASVYMQEGIVSYSNLSKHERLGVAEETLAKFGAVSDETAYEMASGLLQSGADVAIATTGLAGPKSDDTMKPVGLCFIAVGTKQTVHIFKYNIDGDRKTITKTAVNAAIFNAIKLIK